MLNRLLCILQPWNDLRRHSKGSQQSLLAKYTALPPQLAPLQALQARHIMLATVCSAASLANILTVALGGLLYIRDVQILTNQTPEQSLIPRFTASNLTTAPTGQNGAPLQILLSNLSSNTPLPTWTTPQQFFLPIDLPRPAEESSILYKLNTVGFQASLECTQFIENNAAPSSFVFELNEDATEANFSMSQTLPDATIINCFSPNGNPSEGSEDEDTDANNTQVFLLGSPSAANALEIVRQPTPPFINPSAVEHSAQECS